MTAVRLFFSCEGVGVLLRRITFQVSLSEGDNCSMVAFEEVSEATESAFDEVPAFWFTFSLHFFLTDLIVATSELCEAAAVLSVPTLLLTTGAMVVEGEASSVLFISICTSVFSHELGGRSLSLLAELNTLDLALLCLLFFALQLFPLLFGLLLSFVVCVMLSHTIDGPFPLSDSWYYAQQKNQNFPIVRGLKFTGNGQVSMGNLRETEISASPLRNYGT